VFDEALPAERVHAFVDALLLFRVAESWGGHVSLHREQPVAGAEILREAGVPRARRPRRAQDVGGEGLPAERVHAFVDALLLFRVAESWGGHVSLVLPVHPRLPAPKYCVKRACHGLAGRAGLRMSVAKAWPSNHCSRARPSPPTS
jgi:hypothetical protein